MSYLRELLELHWLIWLIRLRLTASLNYSWKDWLLNLKLNLLVWSDSLILIQFINIDQAGWPDHVIVCWEFHQDSITANRLSLITVSSLKSKIYQEKNFFIRIHNLYMIHVFSDSFLLLSHVHFVSMSHVKCSSWNFFTSSDASFLIMS